MSWAGILARATASGREALGRASGRRPPAAPSSAAHRDLDLMFAQLAALHELASDPATAADSDRVYDFSIRWGTFLAGRLQRLDHYADRGELDPLERERYAALQDALRAALPDVRRLGLARPARPAE